MSAALSAVMNRSSGLIDQPLSAMGSGIALERRGAAVERAEVVLLVHGDGDDAAVGLVVEKAPDNL